ncbi:hypothetical protein CQA86_32525, partial [Klebsiella pneumoniae]
RRLSRGYYIVGLLAEAFLQKQAGGENHSRPASDRCFLFDDEASFIEGVLHCRPAGGGVPAETGRGRKSFTTRV